MGDVEQATYQSYLLRLWRDDRQGPWRASLQSTVTAQIHAFSSLDEMWAHLQVQLGLDASKAAAGESLPGAAAGDAQVST